MTKDERSEAEISATAIELAGELLKFCGERAEHHPWVIQRALMLVLSKKMMEQAQTDDTHAMALTYWREHLDFIEQTYKPH